MSPRLETSVWRNRFGAASVPLLVVLAILLGRPSPAGTTGADGASLGMPVTGLEKTRILEDLRKRQGSLDSFRASVLQRRHHPLLREDLESEGTVIFRKPNFVRWDVRTPEHQVLLLDGNTMTTYFPDRREAVRVDLSDRPSARMAVDAFSMGLSAPFKDLERRFLIDLYRDHPFLVLKLTPRSKWISRTLSSILIYHENGSAVPRRVIVTGTKGDRSETILHDVRVNPVLAPGTFELKLEPGIRIEEPAKSRAGIDDGA